MNKKIVRKKATLSFAIIYLFLFMIMVFIFIVGTPFLVQINTSFSEATSDIFRTGEMYANRITDEEMKNSMLDIIQKNLDSTETYSPVVTWWLRYAWMFILIIVTFIVVVFARRAEMMQEQAGMI
jgi:predicted PurR-regulated permease PerM